MVRPTSKTQPLWIAHAHEVLGVELSPELTFHWRCVVTSKITESLRGDLAALHEAGVIDKVTLCEFDTICLPPTQEFSSAGIKSRSHRFSSLARGMTDGAPELDQISQGRLPFRP